MIQAVSQITHHNFGVSWCTFSPDSAVLCTCSWDNSIALSCAETGRFVGNLLGHRNPVTSADFSISGQLVCHIVNLDNINFYYNMTTLSFNHDNLIAGHVVTYIS